MPKLTDSEWAVLDVLWAHGPLALGPVVDALKEATGWSRNTVHTYLTRMENKGLVSIDRGQEPHLYAAAVTQEACARRARHTLLERVYQGRTGDLVAAFLKEETLSAQERDRLRKLLDDMEV